MKLTFLKAPTLLALMISTLAAKPIKPQDIIIVEITSQDVGVRLKSVEEYDTNRLVRHAFRTASAEFLRRAQGKSKFILIDMWYPDLLEMPSDESLLAALKLSPRITFASGGPHNQRFEKSLSHFAEAIPEMGHILLNAEDPSVFFFFPTLCTEDSDWPANKHPCPVKFQQKHIALLAAEKYLGIELSFEPGSIFWVPRNEFKRFHRITYSSFKKNPKVIDNKLVILISKPFPHTDMFDIPGRGRISGSEILAMMIVFYSQDLSAK
ncbi:hypothetical protein [Turneriella parva]|uniref:CHASE2 domain-containing protein n=1 Tax=Turneriella parva (strain ATCC BAA-1111 / DSM 21527 / NCTC 11395 / H) TaxID=869212 RepID=I4BA44_TURPD|nr:hypothetical protein [Turneriella parva]AFM14151.1 hypothetical protein Turpa_3514 [Turneriella parva DSM 21527]